MQSPVELRPFQLSLRRVFPYRAWPNPTIKAFRFKTTQFPSLKSFVLPLHISYNYPRVHSCVILLFLQYLNISLHPNHTSHTNRNHGDFNDGVIHPKRECYLN
jgi:hypothetical protein